MTKEELIKKNELLELTKKRLLETINNNFSKDVVNSNKNPNWLILLRDPLKNRGHWIYGLSKTLFFTLIFSGIVFSFVFFTQEYYKLYKKDSTAIYAEKFIGSLKLDSLKFNQNQIDHLKLKIEKASEEIVNLKSNNKDLNILAFIEHIFIYLMPLLIFFGLYYYFVSNYKYRLLGSSDISKEEIVHSKNALNLTKTLFISSIMAYVIIKIIEKVILAKPQDFPKNEMLIAYGVFLLLLMGYLILSHIGKHKD